MKPQVFYPGKTLDRVEVGTYSVELKKLGRLEDEAEHWYIEIQNRYRRIGNNVFKDSEEARNAFDFAKQRVIIQTACDAMGVGRGGTAAITMKNVTQRTESNVV
jgi:hypothetical protein